MTRSLRRYLGAAQLVTALILTAQPVVQGIHHLRSPHFWCPEHHAFEHPHTKDAYEYQRADMGTEQTFDGSNTVDDDHDICPICHSAQQRALTTVVGGSDAGASDDIARTSEIRRAHEQLAVLTLAPKHSPPFTSNAPASQEPRAS